MGSEMCIRDRHRCDSPQVAVLEGVNRVPHRSVKLEDGRDARQRGRSFGALAASTAVFDLHPTRTARLVANPYRFVEASVAEQFAFVFTVDAGLGEDQVDGVPEGDIQG